MFTFDDAVRILNGDIVGEVVAVIQRRGCCPSYDVSYIDGTGTPVIVEWPEWALSAADDSGGTHASNVVQFPTRHVMHAPVLAAVGGRRLH